MDRNIDMLGTNKNRRSIVAVFLVTGVVSGVLWWWGNQDKPAPVDGWWGGVKFSYNFDDKQPSNQVTSDQETIDKLKTLLKDEKGKYAVYVYNLEKKAGYGLNENEVLPAMSLMKVPIMVATYKAIENGELKIDSLFDYPVEVVDDTASQSATPKIEYKKMSVRTMMKEMGYRSDNTAPVILTRVVGKQKMRDMLIELGMTNSDFDKNTTTAEDIGKMWRKLQEDEVISDEHREELWTFLQKSIYEERIPAGVPEGTKVVHKVGQDVNVWADAGIVDDKLVMVIMNDQVDVEAAKTYVPEEVKLIWELESGLL